MLVYVTLFSFGAAVTDLLKGKIYNNYLLLAAGVGLFLRVLSEGVDVLMQGIAFAVVTFLVLIPVYLLRALGGGDVKMLTVVAILLSRREYLCIGLIAVVLTLSVGLLRFLVRRLQGKGGMTTVAFAVPFFYAVCFSVFSRGML